MRHARAGPFPTAVPHDAGIAMTAAGFDVLGIGDAIVDVIAPVADELLRAQDLEKGRTQLVDAARALELHGALDSPLEVSGGSAANTVAGVAALGARASFIGLVRDDALGRTFARDIRARGVSFDTPPARDGPPTGHCLVLVTPDAQRTLCAHLGASLGLAPADIDRGLVGRARVVFLEGYLLDAPAGVAIFEAAARAAASAGTEVAVSLSDPLCVARHREAFRDFVRESADMLFANEAEAAALYGVEGIDETAARASADVAVAVLTRGAEGSVVAADGARLEIAAHPARVVDSTGAGDLYAAGFLHGYTRGAGLERAARMGAVCAAEAISHFGARPHGDLRALIAQALG